MSPPLLDAPPRPPPRGSVRRGWAASIGALGILLFTWPFVRTPQLGIGASYAHLLGAWASVVVALALLSRALGRAARSQSDDA